MTTKQPGIHELGRSVFGALALLLLLAAPRTRAQEALQMSAASAQAAEARKKAASTLDYTNLNLGPTIWNFKADETTIFTDNVDFSHTAPEADLVFRPELLANLLWPVSPVNALTLKLGAGYSLYVRNSQLDRFFLAPGSETSFDLYSGDFVIDLHDRFAIVDNVFQDASYAGTGDYQRLENTAGVAVTWDMGKLRVQSGYDHATYEAMTDNLRIQAEQSDLFTLSGSYALRPNIRSGLELSLALTSYTWVTNAITLDGDANQWSAGPFVEAQLSPNLALRASVGYTIIEPESGPSLGSRKEGAYARLGFAHRLNEQFDYTLSASREIGFNSFAGIYDAYSVVWQGNWHILRKFTIGTSLVYQHGSQVAYGPETYDWLSPRLLISRPITRRLTAELGYRYYWRASTLPGNEYTADLVSLNLVYRF